MSWAYGPIKSLRVCLQSDVTSPSFGFHSTLSEAPLASAAPHSSGPPLLALRVSVLYSTHRCAHLNPVLPTPTHRMTALKQGSCINSVFLCSIYEALTWQGLIWD